MKLLTILSRNQETVIVSYHWNRKDPKDFCQDIKKVLPEASEEDEPSGLPETSDAVLRAQEVAMLKPGMEVIQGPWVSQQQAHSTLSELIEDSFPELDRTFRHCRSCLC